MLCWGGRGMGGGMLVGRVVLIEVLGRVVVRGGGRAGSGLRGGMGSGKVCRFLLALMVGLYPWGCVRLSYMVNVIFFYYR